MKLIAICTNVSGYYTWHITDLMITLILILSNSLKHGVHIYVHILKLFKARDTLPPIYSYYKNKK